MKKYIHLICSVCQRTVDKLVDNTHFAPDRCTITQDCRGRLFPIEYRSNAQITPASISGIPDWQKRVTDANPASSATAALGDQQLVNTSTGSYQQLVLAVASCPPLSTVAQVTFQLRSDTPKNFKQYTFRYVTSFYTVSGVEAGEEHKTLRFTAYGTDPDLVEVYVNGVKLEQGIEPGKFQIYDGTAGSTVPPNMILLNTGITYTGNTQVDVIVSKIETLQSLTVGFTRNTHVAERTNRGAWENVDYIERFIGGVWVPYYIFVFDVLSNTQLPIDSIMVPVGDVIVNGHPVLQADTMFLLARQPYSTIDRYTDQAAILSSLSIDRDYLKYHHVADVPTLELATTALTTFYPPAKLHRFIPDSIITTPISGVTEQKVLDGLIIVGPDA
jgi:hypothetical protein